MSENATWETQGLFQKRYAMFTAGDIQAFDTYPTQDVGVWESEHHVGDETYHREKYERAGFVVVDTRIVTGRARDTAVIRFRLPDATDAAPVPRYYVDNAGQLHFIRDREHLNEEGKHRIIETMFTREYAEVRAAELNTANTAPVETPQHPVLAALKALRVDEMSPLEALTKLGELQRMLGEE